MTVYDSGAMDNGIWASGLLAINKWLSGGMDGAVAQAMVKKHNTLLEIKSWTAFELTTMHLWKITLRLKSGGYSLIAILVW